MQHSETSRCPAPPAPTAARPPCPAPQYARRTSAALGTVGCSLSTHHWAAKCQSLGKRQHSCGVMLLLCCTLRRGHRVGFRPVNATLPRTSLSMLGRNQMARPATAHDAPATTHRSSTSPSSAPTCGQDFKTPSSGRLTGHITWPPVVTLHGLLTAIPQPGQSRGRCHMGATAALCCAWCRHI